RHHPAHSRRNPPPRRRGQGCGSHLILSAGDFGRLRPHPRRPNRPHRRRVRRGGSHAGQDSLRGGALTLRTLFLLPFAGEGGAKRRMRVVHPRTPNRVCGARSLTRSASVMQSDLSRRERGSTVTAAQRPLEFVHQVFAATSSSPRLRGSTPQAQTTRIWTTT